MKKIIAKIFSYQQDLQNDAVFNSLKNQFFSLLENIKFSEITIYLGSGYNEDKELKASKDVVILETKNAEEKYNILIEIESEEYSYSFEIFNGKVTYGGYYYDEYLLMHCENYEYESDKSKLTKTTELIDRNDYYFDYGIDIITFDNLGNATKKALEENQVFSKKFGIPLDKVEFYRTHFKENSDYINECKVKSEMEYEDNVRNNENSFSSPFNIADFALIFNFDFATNEEHLYSALESLYTFEDLDVAGRRLNFLKEMLENIIGSDGEIIIEDNLYLNIAAYVYNSSTEFLTTRGRIIKKIYGELFMYVIEITNNKVTSIAKHLTKEEASKLYFANEKNFNTEDLREFLGIELSLS